MLYLYYITSLCCFSWKVTSVLCLGWDSPHVWEVCGIHYMRKSLVYKAAKEDCKHCVSGLVCWHEMDHQYLVCSLLAWDGSSVPCVQFAGMRWIISTLCAVCWHEMDHQYLVCSLLAWDGSSVPCVQFAGMRWIISTLCAVCWHEMDHQYLVCSLLAWDGSSVPCVQFAGMRLIISTLCAVVFTLVLPVTRNIGCVNSVIYRIEKSLTDFSTTRKHFKTAQHFVYMTDEKAW